MKKKLLRVVAVVLLFVLLTFTGCSAVGGFSCLNQCTVNQCTGGFLENVGCFSDCLLSINPVTCLCMWVNEDCGECYHGLYVDTCYVCAEDARGSYEYSGKHEDEILCLNRGDSFNDSMYGKPPDPLYDDSFFFIAIYPRIGETVETAVACDGSYVRKETTIYVENKSEYRIEDAYIEIYLPEHTRSYKLGTIPAGQENYTVHYEYAGRPSYPMGDRNEIPTVLDGDSTHYAIFGRIVEE